MASVTFDKATRLYPGSTVPAVDAIDLQIADGEFLVLVGPSGCGKSTTLRMLAGLEEVNDGRILIGDRDVTDVPPKDRDIAMVFQNYALYPHMTVAENMGFALKIAGVGKEERATRVLEAAKLLDLEPYLDRKPKALSGGQRQRVAMVAPSSASRRCSSWTSRCRTSTRSSACRPAPRSPRCSGASASRRSTSRTTRPRPSRWATASRC
jgi:multiple sugar transport system ATP-binding protein